MPRARKNLLRPYRPRFDELPREEQVARRTVVTDLSASVMTQTRPSPTEDAPTLTQGTFVLAVVVVVQVTPVASRVVGQIVVVLGTHTHVPTADVAVLPGGTAYTTDVGMTGCEESIIWFDREDFLGLFLGERRRISVVSRFRWCSTPCLWTSTSKAAGYRG
jgi:hypothetical protein